MTGAVSPRIPTSTYRLQFNQSFTFQDAYAIVPYLHDLGISDCYTSSYLKATPGSQHGYDIADPTVLNPELGTDENYRAFIRSLQDRGMGHILDVVPNHMGIAQSCNRWWLDVLENGPSSIYADFFDIDWHPVKAELEDKVLLPILGDLYGAVLENQEITLCYQDGSFFIRYFDYTLPIAPKSFSRILSLNLHSLLERSGETDPHIQEVQSILTALRHLPSRQVREQAKVQERYREKEIIKRRLAAVIQASPAVAEFVEQNVAAFNGTKDVPQSFDLLDALLNDQVYRLAYWRVAGEEINYRRFFDINELAAIRMENPAVFKEAHSLVLRLLREGAVTGLRIDHVDGLYDPGHYLRQLQAWGRSQFGESGMAAERSLYLVVEKILGKDEHLPDSWPVFGTTGYEFLNRVNGLFVDASHEPMIDEVYAKFTHEPLSFEDLAYQKKKLIMSASMSSEINVLGHQLNRFSERDRRSRDFTLNSLVHAIREIIACFPVYRAYITPDAEPVTDRDKDYIRSAVIKAKSRNPAVNGLVFDFVRDILLTLSDDRLRPDHQERVAFAMKFQQTTSPVTAKGIEDTALYIYNRLLSLNEVGGDPEQFGLSVRTFHEWMQDRQARWPHALSATSTHDTKRSEDVRARINVISEIPVLWKINVARWSKLNKPYKTEVDGAPAPDLNDEYLLYQTLIGAWPLEPLDERQYRIFCDRIQGYMAKALHEAKVHTSWVNPNRVYDQAVEKFVEAILDRTRPNPFLESFLPLEEQIAEVGLYNAMAQVVLKIAAPGVPDFYQGTELWDFSLVDPDNRRPVDYATRREALSDLRRACEDRATDRPALIKDLLDTRRDGRIKLYLVLCGLHYRRTHVSLFQNGRYVPLEIGGAHRDHVCAFARVSEQQSVVVAVPRLVQGLLRKDGSTALEADIWKDTWIWTEPHVERYRNVLTDETLSSACIEDRRALSLVDVFRHCPVALLESVS
ncbi:MAG: malto-oligosyltrehalose synthase [Nitrospiraceae bacterium]|nr:malto-oligosyltrehalose synthase [Nitrospiraceae bacterium]